MGGEGNIYIYFLHCALVPREYLCSKWLNSRFFLRLYRYVNAWKAVICIVYVEGKSPGDSNVKGASELSDVFIRESEIKELIKDSFVMHFSWGRQSEASFLFSRSSHRAL